jgi:Ser/Thr protein kinase RdoA (MazF antagonist)
LAGANWSLFPWVRGRTLVRGKIKPTDANSLGEMHGRIHAVLSRHPASGDPPVLVPWDTGSSLADLALVRAAAEDAGALGEVVDAIDFQMMLLRESAVVPRSVLAGLPAQLTHGDFHDDQVLVNRRGDVRAVVDWGLLRVMPRIWEVIRSLSYSRLLEGECLDSYLAGYRQHVRLSEAECRLGVEAWWYGRLHARWVYWTYFFEKNVRVAEFFAETARHLRQLSDQRWRDDLANRLVRAASAQ